VLNQSFPAPWAYRGPLRRNRSVTATNHKGKDIGKRVCKTFIHRFDSGPRLQQIRFLSESCVVPLIAALCGEKPANVGSKLDQFFHCAAPGVWRSSFSRS
jgi:hypothetical protein